MFVPDFGKVSAVHLQLASAGKWEDAVRPETLTEEDLEAWLLSAAADIAIEAVFKDFDGGLVGFVGFRKILEASRPRLAFWKSLLRQCEPKSNHTPSFFLAAWLKKLESPRLLMNPPTSLELGVFNLWKSAGSVELVEGAELAQLVKTGPSWLRSGATAPICLERVWRTPDRFWIAECVSHLIDGVYYLDADRLSLKRN